MKTHTTLLVGLAVALVALLALLIPAPAFAACGFQDPLACVDGPLYSVWYGVANIGWAINRTLLMLAYQLGVFRWWLVDVAFSSAYQALVTLVGPLLVPIATLAIIVGCIGFLLLPLMGRVELVKLRHALVWAALAPLLLTLSGPLLVEVEQARSDLGSALFTGASQLAPGAIFGAAAGDMQAPAPLYPSNPCGAVLDRRSAPGVLQMDDLAAAMLWADAEDIHCPDLRGPGPDIPDAFYEAAPAGPGYATDQSVSMMDDAAMRAAAIAGMQRGSVRLLLGLLPSTLAVLDALVQLVFALCLIALWIGLPIGLLFVFFQQTASGVTSLFRRAVAVLQVSWSGSFLLGIVFACLLAAANLRNATAYAGFAIGALVLTAYILAVAVDTLKDSIRTLNETVAAATGLSVTRPFAMAGDAAATALTVGAAAATGGAAMGFTALAASRQTQSGQYAAAAALGRIRPLVQVGEVAALMGAIDPAGELYSGLYAGHRMEHSARSGRLQMASDAKRTDEYGRTFEKRAQERGLARILRRSSRRRAADLAAGPPVGDDRGDRAPAVVRDGWQRVQAMQPGEGGEAPRELVAVDVRRTSAPPLRATSAAGVALALDIRGRLQRQVLDADAIPDSALTERRERLNIPRLLTLGYHVQERRDGSVAFWRANSDEDAPARRSVRGESETPSPRVAAVEERERLVGAGALLGDAAAARTETRRVRADDAEERRERQQAAELRRAFARGPSSKAARLQPNGDLGWTDAPEAIPAGAMSVPADQADAGRLLQLGYALQRSRDGSRVLFWRGDGTDSATPSVEVLEGERQQLALAGALLGAAAASGIVAGTPNLGDPPSLAAIRDSLADLARQGAETRAQLDGLARQGAAVEVAVEQAADGERATEGARAAFERRELDDIERTALRQADATTRGETHIASQLADDDEEDRMTFADLAAADAISEEPPPRTQAASERRAAQLAVDIAAAEQQLRELRAASQAQAGYLTQVGRHADAAQVTRWADSRLRWLDGQRDRWTGELATLQAEILTLPVVTSEEPLATPPGSRLARVAHPWPQSAAEITQQVAAVKQQLAALAAEQATLPPAESAEPDDLAQRRAMLARRLERLQARLDAYRTQGSLLAGTSPDQEEA